MEVRKPLPDVGATPGALAAPRLILALITTMASVACAGEPLPRQADRETTPGLVVASLASPGAVVYVARGTVAEEFQFNATVDVADRTEVAAPMTGLILGQLPSRGAQYLSGEPVFSMAPTVEMRAAAAELEAALLAMELGVGDPERVAAATQRAEELGLPTDDRALEPLPESFVVEAPISGTVLASHIPEGGQANQGDIVVELGNTEDLVVTAEVPPEVADLVDEGTEVIVVTRDGRGAPVEGVVGRIEEPEEEGATERTLVIDLATDVFEYQTGVRVSILGTTREDVMWLPPEAIRSHDGTTFVIVVEGERQRRVEVELGVQTDQQVEVTGPLTLGETVAVP